MKHQRDESRVPTPSLARRVLRTVAAATYLGVSSSSLEKWRVTNRGPKFVRLGGRAIGYDIHDLDGWLDSQRDLSDAARS